MSIQKKAAMLRSMDSSILEQVSVNVLSAVPTDKSVSTSTQLSARLTIDVFYANLPATLGKASDPLEPFSQKELSTLDTIRSYPIAYAPGLGVSSQPSSVVGVEPTTPVVLDPFFPQAKAVTPTRIPTPLPTIIREPSPLSSPTPTPILLP